MLQLVAPDRPRPALLASIGIHVMAASAFGFGPLLAFPDAPGWRGEVWVVSQPDLSVLREVRTVDLRDRPATGRPASRPGGGLPAARRETSSTAPRKDTFQPGRVPDELPIPSDLAPADDADVWGVPGGDDEGRAPGTGDEQGRDRDGGPIDVRDGVVRPDVVLPVPLRTPAPGYTEAARISRAQGVVVLSATIASDGSVVDVVVENDAHPLLARIAVDEVSRWRYVAARIGTRPVAVILRVTLTFRLR